MQTAPQIFISHSRRDSAFVEQLARIITTWGMQPWVDRQQLAGGQQWSDELRHAIVASSALVLVLTPTASASPVVRREYLTAIEHHIPVIVVQMKAAIILPMPTELANAPVADFTGARWRGEEALFLRLAESGITPTLPTDAFAIRSPNAAILANHHRMPEGWRWFTVATRWYIVPTFVNFIVAIMSFAVLFRFVPPVVTSQFGILSSNLILSNALFFGELALTFLLGLLLVSFFARGLIFLLFWRQNLPPEMVVVGPESVTANIFLASLQRLSVEPLTYAFSALAQIEPTGDWLGYVHLKLIARTGNRYKILLLPHRLGNAQAAADAICASFAAYQATLPQPEITPTPPLSQTSSLMRSSIPTPVPPTLTPAHTFAAIISPQDLPLFSFIQARLWERGVRLNASTQVPPDHLLLPTFRDVDDAAFTLFFVAPATLQSPQAQGILADLLARGKLVIPILSTPMQPLPPTLAALQWVDFSALVDRERSLADLYNALDLHGVPVTLPGVPLDGALAMARALHERLPVGWQGFHPSAGARQVYRVYRSLAVLTNVLIILGTLAIMGILAFSSVQFIQIADGDLTAIAVSLGASLLFIVGFGLFIFFRYRRRFAGVRFMRRVMRNYYLPEMVILGPAGIVIHIINPRTRLFVDAWLPFAHIHEIRRETAYYSATRLACVLKQGQVVRFTIPNYFTDVAQAGDAILTAFQTYQTTVNLSHDFHKMP